MVSKYSLISTT